MDTMARAFLSAAALYESGQLEKAVGDRYAGWDGDLGKKISGGASLDDLAQIVHEQGISPLPRSGRQERLENIVNNFV
jgi:xylose isomerase